MIPDLVIAESAYLERMKPEDRELLTQILEDSVEDEFNLWNEQIETAKESAREHGVTFVDVDIKPFQENCKSFMRRPPAVLSLGRNCTTGFGRWPDR